MRRIFIPLLLLAIAVAVYLGWRSVGATTAEPRSSLIPLLADEDTAGYARATEAGAVVLPQDLGAHDDYQTEWWYYTGNLETEEGRPFGFQLTFFRRALTPTLPDDALAGNELAGPSPWRTNQVYLAHFTISDIEDEAFYPNERFSRGAAELAGARAEPRHCRPFCTATAVLAPKDLSRETPRITTRWFSSRQKASLASRVATTPSVDWPGRTTSIAPAR
jgi:predicted secreted hydrolase